MVAGFPVYKEPLTHILLYNIQKPWALEVIGIILFPFPSVIGYLMLLLVLGYWILIVYLQVVNCLLMLLTSWLKRIGYWYLMIFLWFFFCHSLWFPCYNEADALSWITSPARLALGFSAQWCSVAMMRSAGHAQPSSSSSSSPSSSSASGDVATFVATGNSYHAGSSCLVKSNDCCIGTWTQMCRLHGFNCLC